MVRLGTHQRTLLLEALDGPTRISVEVLSLADKKRRYQAAYALVRRGLAVIVSKKDFTAAGALRAMRHLELTAAAHDRIRDGLPRSTVSYISLPRRCFDYHDSTRPS